MHSLNVRGFADRDRAGADVVRDAVRDSDVRRIVYLSGLVPDAPADELSRHISSRLEVEEVLAEAASERCSVLSLRAGVVIGAGSTSFEVIRQLATLLLVQPVPSWLEHRVQPIAVSDVLRAMVESFEDDHLTGALDIGGPNVLPYSRLLAECARAAGLLRVRVPTVPVPTPLVSLGAAAMVRRALLDGERPDREPAPRHGLPPGRDLGAQGRRCPSSASARRWPAASAARQRPRGAAAQRPRLDPDARPRPRRAARPAPPSAPAPAWPCGGCGGWWGCSRACRFRNPVVKLAWPE